VSSLLLWKECQKSPLPKMTTEWKTVSLYPIPSVIYLIHNNVQFATLTFVDTSTYQIMGNLKIVTTGILFRCIVFSSNFMINFIFGCWNHSDRATLILQRLLSAVFGNICRLIVILANSLRIQTCI